MLKSVYTGGTGEIEEKKSKFIAHIMPVTTEEEAVNFITSIKKKYFDARHNCSAFAIGKNQELTRCSDDGEPSGTAGRPMLEVLLSEGITNVCVVVTRYFGGTLLGTGGLVRAYTAALKEGLNNSVIIQKTEGKKITVACDYSDVGKLQYIFAKEGYDILDSVYADNVIFYLVVANEKVSALVNELTEATASRVKPEITDDCLFATTDKGIELFEN